MAGVRECRGEFIQCGNENVLGHHPGDGPLGLSDDAQAGISGDTDVGVAQHQGERFGHGQVAHSASSDVTVIP